MLSCHWNIRHQLSTQNVRHPEKRPFRNTRPDVPKLTKQNFYPIWINIFLTSIIFVLFYLLHFPMKSTPSCAKTTCEESDLHLPQPNSFGASTKLAFQWCSRKRSEPSPQRINHCINYSFWKHRISFKSMNFQAEMQSFIVPQNSLLDP